MDPTRTPDGRYVVVDGVLWRAARPDLAPRQRALLVAALMRARRDVAAARRARDDDALADARARVQRAKVALGERGAPWWTDGAPDWNRRRVDATPYASWWRGRARRGRTGWRPSTSTR